MKKKGIELNFAYVAAAAFLGAYSFFQFFYPYHLIRREQLSLFLYDWDYICQTYKGSGWLALFLSDFLEQFFRLPAAGPAVIAAILTGIGYVTYKIFRHFLGRWPSLAVATVIFAWCFLRETGAVFCTRYTLAVLGYLSLILAALSFPKAWMKPVAAALLLCGGTWALGAPVDRQHGRLFAKPDLQLDKVIGMDTEVYRENWDKVLRLSKGAGNYTEASYAYNIAHGMKGDLPYALFQRPQNYSKSLLFWSSPSPFNVGVAGEAWFQLGDMTLAEQCAIISLLAMPNHAGSRPLIRMAQCNLATGDSGAAQKYLELLSKSLFYGKWARGLLTDAPDESTAIWLEKARKNQAGSDVVYDENEFRPILLGLLEANPSNTLARDYLLCYDLLRFNLDLFLEDYERQGMPNGTIYKEAVLLCLGNNGRLSMEEASRYGVDESMVDRMLRFTRYPNNYKNTYWYFYMNSMED